MKINSHGQRILEMLCVRDVMQAKRVVLRFLVVTFKKGKKKQMKLILIINLI